MRSSTGTETVIRNARMGKCEGNVALKEEAEGDGEQGKGERGCLKRKVVEEEKRWGTEIE